MAFNFTTIPTLPTGFVDCSWRNDVCSHFEKEWNGFIIEIWIEYDNPIRRENVHQYSVVIRKPGESEHEDMEEFTADDFSEEAMRQVALRLHRAVFKLMRKYY